MNDKCLRYWRKIYNELALQDTRIAALEGKAQQAPIISEMDEAYAAKAPENNEEPMPTTEMKSKSVQTAAYSKFADVFFSQWAKGRVKYGSDLMTHNGRNAGNDAMQEACDLVAYIMQMIMEREDLDACLAALESQAKPAPEASVPTSELLADHLFVYVYDESLPNGGDYSYATPEQVKAEAVRLGLLDSYELGFNDARQLFESASKAGAE
jgi:hypothetical protein